ncbi:MAG: AMP-binding protein [Alphaproteobacteria bacterium]|nr:AMP-binding protein [Alphaproteobacteria bacterium]
MRIPDPPMEPARIAEFTRLGYWTETTSNDVLERTARESPNKLAIVDGRVRLSYREYFRRAERLAAHLVGLGLGAEDVVAVQLPNWSEFPIAINAAMLAGIPFCQFHADFRVREVEFILHFTEASALILPRHFRRFDYLDMLGRLRPNLPHLRHVLVVGEDLTAEYFDLRRFLDARDELPLDRELLRRRRPKGNDLARTAFTSGTTGDPKAVLHLHNTTNCAARFVNEGHRIGPESVLLAFLPVGLNWGLLNVLQAIFAGCTLVLQELFDATQALALIEGERVTHFCCAPAHLVSLLNVPDLDHYDLSSVQMMTTGGASCPIEVIREVRARLPGHLLELYGMLECGFQSHTMPDEDPEVVCGSVGRPLPQMGVRIVDDNGKDCPPGTSGEILTYGPSVTIGYFNNREANARSFTADGWFATGDIGIFDENGYLKIIDRKKELIIRGGANIYPREIEELLFQHPTVLEAAAVGVPDPRLGERVCACVVPRPGESLTLDELVLFLKDKIATYKMPEFLYLVGTLPRTPTGKIQKGPLRDFVLKGIASA